MQRPVSLLRASQILPFIEAFFCRGLTRQQHLEVNDSEIHQQQSSVWAAEPSAACGQFTPPPLTEEFTVLLNSQPDIEYFLDGTFEAMEIVVDETCRGVGGEAEGKKSRSESEGRKV